MRQNCWLVIRTCVLLIMVASCHGWTNRGLMAPTASQIGRTVKSCGGHRCSVQSNQRHQHRLAVFLSTTIGTPKRTMRRMTTSSDHEDDRMKDNDPPQTPTTTLCSNSNSSAWNNSLVFSSQSERAEKALFGMGCFWNPQEAFENVPGVIQVTTGYASIRGNHPSDDDSNENNSNSFTKPSYLTVCAGDGNTEAVLVEYLPDQVSYQQLLQTFWQQHDASIKPDKIQYRSVLWPLTKEQVHIAAQDVQSAHAAYQQRGLGRVQTVIVSPAVVDSDVIDTTLLFTPAESIHQHFWPKFRLKAALLASSAFVSSSMQGGDIAAATIAKTTLSLAFLWILWETTELVISGVTSIGIIRVSQD